MFRTRFMTSSLATVAVASAITLAAPGAAQAAERGCGLPAVEAVFETVVTDPVYDEVPAITHTEWRWARDVEVHEFEFTRTVSPERVEVDWSRRVPGPIELLFQRTVIDSPAVPAVPGTPEVGHEEFYEVTPAVLRTEVLFVHENTGAQRWEDEDWSAQNGQGRGWIKTDQTREVVEIPAVLGTRWVVDVPATPGTPEIPAVTHVESLWALSHPGADWTGPLDERAGESVLETATTSGGSPDGEGWTEEDTRTVPAVVETDWAPVIPADGTWTGNSRVVGTEHLETEATSAIPPFGPGWYPVDGSAVVVTDREATQVLLIPGSTEQVEVSPALPATEACPDVDDPEVNGPEVSGPKGDGADGGTMAPAPQAAPAPSATVSPAGLPNTGGVPNWMAPLGLATMLAGAILVRTTRKRADLI